MKNLPYDYFRCHGESNGSSCVKRDACIRFTQLKLTAPWTASSEKACNESFPHFIRDENIDEQH